MLIGGKEKVSYTKKAISLNQRLKISSKNPQNPAWKFGFIHRIFAS
jgi:hypothetical protein